MKRKRMLKKVLNLMNEEQLKRSAEIRDPWKHNFELDDTVYDMVADAYYDAFWRNRYKLGLYTIDDVKKAGLW